MIKEQFKKYREKYICNSKPTDFWLDVKSLHKIEILRTTDKTGINKGFTFASLTRKEYDIFNTWTKKEQLQFLEDYFNFYMVMMD